MKLTDIHDHDRLADRFWAKVDKGPHPGGCWLWTAARKGNGYGEVGIWVGGRQMVLSAHRVAYILAYGAVCDTADVCHSCDICYARSDRTYRRCVNPAHLWQGTRKENLADMAAKGRRVITPRPQPGERNPAVKLTADVVRAIRRRSAAGEQQNHLAAEYGVHKATINDIVRRKTWRHVTD